MTTQRSEGKENLINGKVVRSRIKVGITQYNNGGTGTLGGWGIKESQPDKSGGRVCGTTKKEARRPRGIAREGLANTRSHDIWPPNCATIGAPSKLK